MAVRRLRIRRYYCLGLDGNLQLPRESLRVALANTHGYCDSNRNCDSNRKRKCDANCNGDGYRGAEVYADAQAASDTSASAVRSALAHVSSGTRVNSRVPEMRTSLEERLLAAPKSRRG